jgi:hypothetical protein
MATRTALALHLAGVPAPRRGLARRAGKLALELLLGAVLLAGATVAVMLLFLLVVIAAPLAAGLALWLVWRSGDVASREAHRVRARLRRRARALGLVVLAGSQPALLRLAAAAGARPNATPRTVR